MTIQRSLSYIIFFTFGLTQFSYTGPEKRIHFFPENSTSSEISFSISPWHDIPILSDLTGNFNYVNEIPKGTREKMECATKEPLNPIKQDEKDGKPRSFTFGKIPFNYGFIPQTYEDPSTVHPILNLNGDNDPLDVVEVSTGAIPMGAVVSLKVIGIMALIDEGEVDWKVIGINSASPLARLISSPSDLESVMPGVETTIREWFRMYKTTDGKPMNSFGFDEKILPKSAALEVIDETHTAWKKLVAGEFEANGLEIQMQQK